MLTIRVLSALKANSSPAITGDWPWDHPVEPEKFTDEDRAVAKRRLTLVSAIPD